MQIGTKNVRIWTKNGPKIFTPACLPACLALLVKFLSDFLSGTSCLRDLVLTVPPAVSLGETVQLNCSYHLQGESLYAIKLYKGRNEFLTYAAERNPPLRSFSLKGIHLGVSTI